MSCGLEEVITVYPPTVTNKNPLYNSEEFLDWYVDFTTNEADQPESFSGTEIYYKIYNNSNTLVSQRSSILGVNYSTNSDQAAKLLKDTYTYQKLNTKPTSIRDKQPVFIKGKNKSQRVILRLKDYQPAIGSGDIQENPYSFRAVFMLDETIVKDSSGIEMLPCRSVSANNGFKTFDFFDDAEKDDDFNVLPVEGDLDYNHSSDSTSADEYYVQLFAVGVAFNSESLTDAYSLVLDLGSIPIKKGK